MSAHEGFDARREDVQTFWSRVVDEAALRRAEAKYDRMALVAATPPDDPRRAEAIRALARDYPGSLREAELTSPEVCERRREASRRRPSATRWGWCAASSASVEATIAAGFTPGPAPVRVEPLHVDEVFAVGGGGGSGASSLDAAAVAVTLWLDLHVAIADVLRARGHHRTGAPLHEFLATAPADVAGRWPVGRARDVFGELPLRPRTAYLWLAWQAGMDVVSLHRVLFTRIGSWALRPEDPPWAHPRTAASPGRPG